MKVSTILSLFRFIVFLLERSEKSFDKKAAVANDQISRLIVQREEATAENAKAKRAQKKIRELLT